MQDMLFDMVVSQAKQTSFVCLWLVLCILLKRMVLTLILAAHILQVQAVLLLLGGREVPPTMPAIPMISHHNNRVLY